MYLIIKLKIIEIMKIFMLQTLNLINSTNPKRAENIIKNSRIIERENKQPYFILNGRRTN
jgi:hypothetical protein